MLGYDKIPFFGNLFAEVTYQDFNDEFKEFI